MVSSVVLLVNATLRLESMRWYRHTVHTEQRLLSEASLLFDWGTRLPLAVSFGFWARCFHTLLRVFWHMEWSI